MDALEFLMERIEDGKCVVSDVAPDEDCKRIVTAVEQWSKEHPRKTRQSVFLEQYPNAVISDGVLNLTPCNIDQSLYDIQTCNDADCSKCRREFWMQEVE